MMNLNKQSSLLSLVAFTTIGILLFIPIHSIGNHSDNNQAKLKKPTIDDAHASKIANVWTHLFNNGEIGGTWDPSFEWPAGSGLNYLYDGGIWVGGINPDNEIHCSSYYWYDGGLSPTKNLEDTILVYQPGDPHFQNRPNVHESFKGSPVSVEDTYSAYMDIDVRYHDPTEKPLGLKVIERTYKWTDDYNDDFIIYDYQIINIGIDTDQDLTPDSLQKIRDVYIGIWFDGDISFISSLDDLTDYLPEKQTSYLYDAGDEIGDNGLSEGFLYVRLLKAAGGTPNRSHINPCSHSWWHWTNDPTSDYLQYQFMSTPAYSDVPATPYDYRFLQAVGPFDMEPGDTINTVYAMGVGHGMEGMIRDSDWAKKIFDAGYRAAASPDPPQLTLEKNEGSVRLTWDSSAEASIDPMTGEEDFEGYRIYKSRRIDEFGSEIWIKLADFDKVNSVGANTGLQYEYIDTDLLAGYGYSYAVTSYDRGDPDQGLDILESNKRDERSSTHITMGTSSEKITSEIYVYPNPYVGSVEWDHVLTADEPYKRKLVFANLPPGYVKITVLTLAGDVVDTIIKDNEDDLVIWDLLTQYDREIASGIYLFAVESESVQHIGKFVVIQ
jgi:hypothetical protein